MSDDGFSLEDARALAREAHAGQTDKLGVDYLEHVAAVADGLVDFDLDVQVAGWLHDVVEDTAFTLEDLRARGVSDRSLAAVALVSKNLHPELDYLEGVRQLTGSRDAVLVKLSDNAHNSRPDRVEALAELTGRPPGTKYAEARAILRDAAASDDVIAIHGRVAPSLLREQQD